MDFDTILPTHFVPYIYFFCIFIVLLSFAESVSCRMLGIVKLCRNHKKQNADFAQIVKKFAQPCDLTTSAFRSSAPFPLRANLMDYPQN